MTEVEALLSVDAGTVPPGAIAFFPRDPEAPVRRVRAVMALAVGAVALGFAIGGMSREPIALLLLAAGMLGVTASRTSPEPDDPVSKRPTLVVTPSGMIVRDAWGLRSWQFDELSEVRPYLHQRQVGLLIVRQDGSRDFIDNHLFERGESVGELVGRRLKPRAT
jgi:hypothetical protein